MCAQPLRRTKTCGAARTQGRLESAARGCKKQKKGISGGSAVGARSRAPPAAETVRRKCWAAMRAMQGRAKAAAARHMATGSAPRAAVKRQKKRISGCSAVGSAPHLGCGCRGFESRHSDQSECPYEHSDFLLFKCCYEHRYQAEYSYNTRPFSKRCLYHKILF